MKKAVLILLMAAVALVVSTETVHAASLGQRTLMFRMRGSDVALLQRKLNALGLNAGPVDGIYGSQTEQAVVRFQQRYGLRIDGIAGPETIKTLLNQVISYTVRRGDSLWTIASRYGVTVQRLKTANNLSSSYIYPGQVLQIPCNSSNTRYGNSQAIDLLARLVYAEARGEPFTGQVAVAAVVLNRVEDSRFPNTVSGVIYQPYQFEPVSNGQIYQQPNATAYKAAQAALSGWDPTYGAVFFYNPGKVSHSWLAHRTLTTRIGNHVFLR